MTCEIDLESVYVPSEDIVARSIEGEIIIVPLTAETGNDGTIFTLNHTGQEIWKLLDGQQSLDVIIEKLCVEFQAEKSQIKVDVQGLVSELVRRKILVQQ
jgi:hypothetical protein